MKVAYVGNFLPRHSTESHIAWTLEDMGHEVERIQENGFLMTSETIGNLVEDFQADLFLYTRTWGFADGPQNGLEMLAKLRRLGIPSASLHLDLYIGISREVGLVDDVFWNTDYVFTPDGDPESQVAFKNLGVNHFYLPPGVFDRECYYGRPRERFQHDVVFVGSDGNGYHSEWNYRRELVDWLRSTYGDRFMRYGNYSEVIRNEDLNDLYASAKVVIGDSLNIRKGELFTHERYWSDRVHETTGRGGFIIHPYIKGLEDHFQLEDDPDSPCHWTEIELITYTYSDFKGLKELIDHFIDDYATRERIRLNGHMRTKQSGTYRHRLTEMFKLLADNDSGIANKLKEQHA